MSNNLSKTPSPLSPWVDNSGRPTQIFIQFMTALASSKVGPLVSAANDTAAAAAGVGIGQLYQNSGAVRIRLS